MKKQKLAEIKFVCVLFEIEHDDSFIEYCYEKKLEYICNGAIRKLRQEYDYKEER